MWRYVFMVPQQSSEIQTMAPQYRSLYATRAELVLTKIDIQLLVRYQIEREFGKWKTCAVERGSRKRRRWRKQKKKKSRKTDKGTVSYLSGSERGVAGCERDGDKEQRMRDVYADRVWLCWWSGVRQYGGRRHIAHSSRTQHILKCIRPPYKITISYVDVSERRHAPHIHIGENYKQQFSGVFEMRTTSASRCQQHIKRN